MLKILNLLLLLSIFSFPLTAAQATTTILAESLNLRYDNPDDGVNAWPKRQKIVLAHILTLAPDVLGMQEVLAHQLDWLDKNLADYDYIGVGRKDGKRAGEFVPLLYNKKHLKKLDSGYFWLSETPNVAGSIGWLADLPRVVSWGHFSKGAKDFFVFDAHFSHVSDLARQKSAEFLLSYIPTIAGDKPVILLGDFNALDGSSAYNTLVSPSHLAFHDVAKMTGAKLDKTYNGFGQDDGYRIDYIFISKGLNSEDYRRYKISADGVYISDHFPISAVIKLP